MPVGKIQRIYRDFQDLKEEIMKHKWIESEKAGHDVGLEFAIKDWMKNHRENWLKSRREKQTI